MGASRMYKAQTPYLHTSVRNVDYAQSADVMYTVHLDYAVYKATRLNHTQWRFDPVTFGPTIGIPGPPTGVANKPNMTGYVATTYNYKLTAIGGTREQESRPSTALALVNDLTLVGNTNVLTMPALPAGGERWVVYKEQSGGYGYIGGTDGTTFTDGNPQILPILSDTPPIATDPFNAVNKYPSSVAFHEQRLMLGGSRSLPNAVWGSQPANFENMDVSRPGKADDSLSFALVAEKVNSVNRIVSMDDFMVLTSNAVFSVNGGGENLPLTPASIVPKRENSRGGSRLKPIVLDDIIFYMPVKGSTVRTLGFQFEVDGYQSNNITVFSPHFFTGYNIIDWAYVEEPYSAIFAVRSDGALLCFTWEAEQQVWGWTMFETEGRFKTVGVITEGGYDRLYAMVERDINGVTRRFHERLALPHVDDITTACHLDCSVTQVYETAQNQIDGLSHLEGAMVSAYYDGYVAHDLIVVNGKITLPNGVTANIATVGLRYAGEIETLPMVMAGRDGSMHMNQQNIAKLWMRTIDTRGVTAGITGAAQERVVEREGGEDGLDDVLQRDYDITPGGSWDEATTITIRQDEPMPAHITGLFVEPRVSKK